MLLGFAVQCWRDHESQLSDNSSEQLFMTLSSLLPSFDAQGAILATPCGKYICIGLPTQ